MIHEINGRARPGAGSTLDAGIDRIPFCSVQEIGYLITKREFYCH
jgi:hypothetical protein